nr:hypothetical protein [Tanacetum cinerariifolium]
MPPRRLRKKSVKKLVERRVAKVIEEYENTRADSINAGGSGSTSTGGSADVQGCSYKTFMNCKPHSFNGTEGVVGLRRWSSGVISGWKPRVHPPTSELPQLDKTRRSSFVSLQSIVFHFPPHDLKWRPENSTKYVVPTGRVVVPTGRAVPAGRDVLAGKAVPAGRVIPAGRVVLAGRVVPAGRVCNAPLRKKDVMS